MAQDQSSRSRYFATILAEAGVWWSCRDEYGTCQHPECYKLTAKGLESSIRVLAKKLPVNVATITAAQAELSAIVAHEDAQNVRRQLLDKVSAPYRSAIEEAELEFHRRPVPNRREPRRRVF